MGKTSSDMDGLEDAIAMLAKMADKAKKLQDAAEESKDLDEFRMKAGLRRGLHRAPLLTKEDALRASSSKEAAAEVEEEEAIAEDIGKFLAED